MNTTIIRQALEHSLNLGIISDLPWFTTLQQEALKELASYQDKGNGGETLRTAPSALASCSWPKVEACET